MTLWALAVFTLCFVLFHGREAVASGSWDYILTHDDDYLYVSIANGYTQEPKSDANPFYHEERGRTNSVLDYATVAFVGTVADVLQVPVPWLMPFWKILIPLLLWYTLSMCLVYFWGLSVTWSAALGMLLLLSMDLFHGSSQFALMRFPHPGDGMWLAFLFVSMVLRVERVGRSYPWLLTALALVILVICPYYVIIGGWLLFFMTAWSVYVGQSHTARRHLTPLLLIGGLCLARVVQVVVSATSSPYLRQALTFFESSGVLDVSSLVLFGLALLAVGVYAQWRRANLTTLDAALLGILALESLTANTQILLGNDHQISPHRYYHLVIEFACIVGWLAEKLPAMLTRVRGTLWDWLFPVSLLCSEACILAHPDLNWFRYLPRTDPTHFMTDNDLLILKVLPLLLLLVWLPFRSPRGVRWLRHQGRGLAVVSLVALTLYAVKPSQLRAKNENIPFAGAIEWLAENCSPGSVVLTMPGRWTHIDYSMLYAPVKSYTNFVGNYWSDEPEVEKYRTSYYVALREGLLPRASFEGLSGPRELTGYLRLDYVLVDRNGPFLEKINAQLGEFAIEVYADEKCVLLKISA